MALEQHGEYNGYVYGAPGANNVREIEPYAAGKADGIAPVSTNSPGCLGFLLGGIVVLVSSALDFRKAQLNAEVARYQADRNLDQVVAQVTARLEDTTRHLQAGISPGVSIHDIDRTSWGVSQSPPERQTNGAAVNMNTFTPTSGWDPYDPDIVIEPEGDTYG